MRIAVVNLTGGGLSGGYRKYLQNILPLLAKDYRVDGLEVYIPIDHDIFSNKTFTLHNIPVDNFSNRKVWIRNKLVVSQPDVIFIPSAMWINCGQIPMITMIQNMEPLIVPFQENPLKECIKNIGRYMINLHACRKANRVIAISKFVKTFLIEQWRVAEARIGLVYHGIDFTTQAADDHGVIVSLKSLPFLFTVGSVRPARGLEDIIKAFALLKIAQPVRLAIGGNVDRGMEPYFNKLQKMAINLGIADRIHWLGKLNDLEMTWCYSHCDAFIMTSRVEACPNIALEAMGHGCVSIASENPPLPEFFGVSALYYPPKDSTALARQIQAVKSMRQTERAAMSSAARDIASRFSWEICAQKTVTELQKVLQ